MKTLKTALCATAVCTMLAASPALAAPVAYFSASGIQNMGNADAFSGQNNTQRSAAHEVIFDFSEAFDNETRAVVLWELGGSGTGSALVIDEDEVHFFTSNSHTLVTTGNHGLTGPTRQRADRHCV